MIFVGGVKLALVVSEDDVDDEDVDGGDGGDDADGLLSHVKDAIVGEEVALVVSRDDTDDEEDVDGDELVGIEDSIVEEGVVDAVDGSLVNSVGDIDDEDGGEDGGEVVVDEDIIVVEEVKDALVVSRDDTVVVLEELLLLVAVVAFAPAAMGVIVALVPFPTGCGSSNSCILCHFPLWSLYRYADAGL